MPVAIGVRLCFGSVQDMHATHLNFQVRRLGFNNTKGEKPSLMADAEKTTGQVSPDWGSLAFASLLRFLGKPADPDRGAPP